MAGIRFFTLAVVVAALAVGLFAPAAGASQLIARDATNVKLQVDRSGKALITYRVQGRTRNVLAWGAVNALHATQMRRQVAFRVDYSGGWATYRRTLARGFRSVCGKYTGPALAWFVTGCTMRDGSHWALQAWQRGLPNLGLDPWKPLQGSVELRLSHWTGELPKLEIWTNWAYSRRFDHLFGRANIGLASAASTVLLLTVLAVVAPWWYARQRAVRVRGA